MYFRRSRRRSDRRGRRRRSRRRSSDRRGLCSWASWARGKRGEAAVAAAAAKESRRHSLTSFFFWGGVGVGGIFDNADLQYESNTSSTNIYLGPRFRSMTVQYFKNVITLPQNQM